MKINIEHGIPFIEAIFKHNNKEIVVSNVLIDTGAASSIISVDYEMPLRLFFYINEILENMLKN